MAFPTTPLIEDGTGPDANPVGTPWLSPIWGEAAMRRLSGDLQGTTGSWNDAGYNVVEGPDTEIYAYIDQQDSASRFNLHFKANAIGASASTLNDYFLAVNLGAGTISLAKNVAGVGTTLASYTQVIANGDGIGMSIVGNSIQVYYSAHGGAFTALGAPVTDSALAGATGYLAVEIAGTVTRLRLGGGTVSGAPQNTAVPTITGQPQAGQTLTATTGTWTGGPTGFSYQWQTSATGTGGWTAILGATSATYTATGADVGQFLRVVVTATNAQGGASANSASTAAGVAASIGFPTRGILFDPGTVQQDENPLSQGGQFLGPIQGGKQQLQIVAKQIVAEGGVGSTNQSRSAASYGPDCEVTVVVPTVPASGGGVLLWARIQNPGTSSMDGYVWWYSPGVGWRYYRVDNGAFTQLGATDTTYVLAAGDSSGFSVIGNVLAGYHAPAGHAWVAHSTVTDSTYPGAGPIGWDLDIGPSVLGGAYTLLGGGNTIPVIAGGLTTLHAG